MEDDLIYRLTPPLDLLMFVLCGRQQIHGDVEDHEDVASKELIVAFYYLVCFTSQG